MIRLIRQQLKTVLFLNSAFISRVQVLVLNALDVAALDQLIGRAEAHIGKPLPLKEGARQELTAMADGDGRYLINLMETILELCQDGQPPLDAEGLAQLLSKRALNYDRAGDEHYNLISALHKSLRASDCDAGLYWLARMMLAGEDPYYILRRLTRFASEDIGLAAPEAVGKAISAWQSYERLGSPEGDLAIAELVIFLATAPKSNAIYSAWKQAMKTAKDAGHYNPPKYILNAPTQLMKADHGKGYVYDHDAEEGFSAQNCFPDNLARIALYQPTRAGSSEE